MKKLYVGNLPFQATEEQLSAFFAQTGVTAANVTLVRDRFSGQPRGFGFVEMKDDTAAAKAIAELNGSMVGGRPIKVNEAKAKPEKGFGDKGERNFNRPGSYNQTRY